ncbi:MAG: hypothetical protein MUF42_16235 [Cytophagaceae bacterium]|jgi:hypothetical protein|nr:hypothetical protein [Cytophagaceae bacterium]
MENLLVLSVKECDVFMNKNHNQMIVVWKPESILDSRFRELLSIFADLARKNRPESIFVDARQHKNAILAETQKWHDEVIIPLYFSSGVKRMGFLTPQSAFSEFSHKNIFNKEKAKSSIETRFFKSEQEAYSFLHAGT